MRHLIKGITSSRNTFRPSDWSERLSSVLSSYKKTNTKGSGYSMYVMPTSIDGIKSIILDTELGEVEPLALEFVLNFAKDNDLVIEENFEQKSKVVYLNFA